MEAYLDMIRFLIITLLFFLIQSEVFCQEKVPSTGKDARKGRPAFIDISFGMNNSRFRDFATSPLFFKGTPFYISLSQLKLGAKRERETGLFYSFGTYKSDFNNHINKSKVNTLTSNYSQLYQLNKWGNESLNVKVGGSISITSIFRINESLQNNAVGIDIIPTIFGSIKVTKDISRREATEKNFLFFRYNLKQRNRNFAFRFNIGLFNSSYRNGYIYSGQSYIINDPNIFDGYQFNAFSGFRLNSNLDYTVILKNKNRIQISYLWEAYKTNDKYGQLEMANHVIKLSLLFNTNNK